MNKNLSKYSQVRFCFGVFIVRNAMVQSEFKFDARFMIYCFLDFNLLLHLNDVSYFVFLWREGLPPWLTLYCFCLRCYTNLFYL
jgi:hypothetical protein